METEPHFDFEIFHSLEHFWILIIIQDVLILVQLCNYLQEAKDRHICDNLVSQAHFGRLILAFLIHISDLFRVMEFPDQ